MNRTAVATALFLIGVLVGVIPLASLSEPAGTDPSGPVPISRLLTSPGEYGEKAVRIRGTVAKKARAVFPNGRPYSTLMVGDGERAITVFSWEDPPVENGDSVEVSGTFHIWRYNLSQMIESRRITRFGPQTEPPRRPRATAR